MRVSKSRVFAAAVYLCALTVSGLAQEVTPKDASTETIIQLTETPLLNNAKRMGLNLGGPDHLGAAQFMKNILPNPGFESGEFGTVWHTDSNASGTRAPQDFWSVSWNNDQFSIGQPVGFWNGADYEIVYGAAAGRTGKVSNFTHELGKYTWHFDSSGPTPDNWSVVFARQKFTKSFGTKTQSVQADTSTVRPGSPGVQSFHATFPGATWQSVWSTFFDSYWRDSEFEAGKMMVIKGAWRIEFWAKGRNIGDKLRVRFFREGEGSFYDAEVSLSTEWTKHTLNFNVPEGADTPGPYSPFQYHPILGLSFYINNIGGEVWLDDAYIGRSDWVNPTAFSDTFVNRLKELRPGVLRDWRVQFGASLDNEISDPFARMYTAWRPHERKATTWGYSLHEFLQLCQDVDAEPWYSIPPTFTPDELRDLTAYLCAPVSTGHPYALKRQALGQTEPWTTVFPKIHLEYGNELWGAASGSDPFFGASMLGGVRLGKIANDRFAILRSGDSYDAAKLNLIIGGQNGAPNRQNELMTESTNHDNIAIAPYFGTLDTWNSNEEIYYPLFTRALRTGDSKAFQIKNIIDSYGRGTEMSIYEINYHTTGGPAPGAIRNPFVAGASGALALPLNMLCFQRDLGINTQCAFTALQFGFKYDNSNYVRLWGLLRDVEGTQRKRPTWLGLEMVNKGIFGNMVQANRIGLNPTRPVAAQNGIASPTTLEVVQPFAYHDGFDHSAILFNLDLDTAHPVQLAHFQRPQNTATRFQFAPANIIQTNETAQNLDYTTTPITDFSEAYSTILPPRSLTVYTWSTKMGLTSAPSFLIFPNTEILSIVDSAITVTNEATTSGPRSILSVTPISGDTSAFQLLSSVPSAAITPGSSLPLQFRFAPTVNGLRTATYQVVTDDLDFPSFTITLQGLGFGDDDGDGVPVSLDAFPNNPNDWDDTDGDGMGDNFENWIISAAQTDGNPGNDNILTFDDVLPFDDFDGDGYINIAEFIYGTDPTDGTTSLPVRGTWMTAVLLALAGSVALGRRRNRERIALQRSR